MQTSSTHICHAVVGLSEEKAPSNKKPNGFRETFISSLHRSSRDFSCDANWNEALDWRKCKVQGGGVTDNL